MQTSTPNFDELNHMKSHADVVAGLVPATPGLKHRANNRGGRDKPGHDMRTVIDWNPL